MKFFKVGIQTTTWSKNSCIFCNLNLNWIGSEEENSQICKQTLYKTTCCWEEQREISNQSFNTFYQGCIFWPGGLFFSPLQFLKCLFSSPNLFCTPPPLLDFKKMLPPPLIPTNWSILLSMSIGNSRGEIFCFSFKELQILYQNHDFTEFLSSKIW